MIKDPNLWAAWEAAGPLREPADFRTNLRILEGMYDLARSLGALPPADALAGLETDIRVARILNNVPGTASADRPGA